MRRGAGATIVLLVLSDDGLSNTVASIVMLQSSVLFPGCFFVQSQEKETVLVFVLPLLREIITICLDLAYGITHCLGMIY